MTVNNFHGLPTVILENDQLRIEALAEAGPRIVRMFLAGSQDNLLAEQPHKQWETPYGTFFIRGGHRLWHAPEVFPRTLHPDNEGVVVEQHATSLTLRGPVEAGTGIAKTMTIDLHSETSALTITHTMHNHGLWAVELAPWAITQVPSGGAAILPLYAPTEPSSKLLPNRSLVFWPYAQPDDPRWHFESEALIVTTDPKLAPAKVGAFAPAGWIAYLREGVLLVKEFEVLTDARYPDMGCNIECYVDAWNLEVESLAPLVELAPDSAVTYRETWHVLEMSDLSSDRAGALSALARWRERSGL